MKTIVKSLSIVLFIAIVIGFLFSIYILNAPPINQTKPPTLQVHTRAAIRGRPTVNSKPLAHTKSQELFELDRRYISNLSIGIFSKELLFNLALGQRAKYTDALLDKELKTVFNWQKMFDESLGGIKLKTRTPDVKVLISGNDWLVIDNNGAGYSVQRKGNELEVYLPNFIDVFQANNVSLSNDLDFSVVKAGKEWLLTDNEFQQNYEIKNTGKKLDILQQSKYPVEQLLFQVDLASATKLSEGTFSSELYQAFEKKKIPLTNKTKLIAAEDGMSWEVIEGPQRYTIQKDDSWLSVHVNLESDWLYINVADRLMGWIPSKSGTILFPPDPILSSRQQLKVKLVEFVDRLKAAFGVSKQSDKPQDSEELTG